MDSIGLMSIALISSTEVLTEFHERLIPCSRALAWEHLSSKQSFEAVPNENLEPKKDVWVSHYPGFNLQQPALPQGVKNLVLRLFLAYASFVPVCWACDLLCGASAGCGGEGWCTTVRRS